MRQEINIPIFLRSRRRKSEAPGDGTPAAFEISIDPAARKSDIIALRLEGNARTVPSAIRGAWGRADG